MKVVLLVGVPASGKTWVADRLAGRYTVLRHDDYERSAYIEVLLQATQGSKDVLAEAPFNAAGLVAVLESGGIKVEQWLVTGDLDEIKKRYRLRNGLDYPKNFETNYYRYEADTERFTGGGTSDMVYNLLTRG